MAANLGCRERTAEHPAAHGREDALADVDPDTAPFAAVLRAVEVHEAGPQRPIGGIAGFHFRADGHGRTAVPNWTQPPVEGSLTAMMMKSILPALALLAAFPAAAQETADQTTTAAKPETAAPKPPKTVSGPAFVHDGDTIYIDGKGHRLFGISAPEMDAAGGLEARTVLDDTLAAGGGQVECSLTGRKTFNRPVAICRSGDRDLAVAVLQSGWAVTWRSYLYGRGSTPDLAADYWAAETAARAAGIGLWAKPADDRWWDSWWFEIGKTFLTIAGAVVGFYLAADFNYTRNRRLQERARQGEAVSLAIAFASEFGVRMSLLESMLKGLQNPTTAPSGMPEFDDFLKISLDPMQTYEALRPRLTILEPDVVNKVVSAHSLHDTLKAMTDDLKDTYAPGRSGIPATMVTILKNAVTLALEEFRGATQKLEGVYSVADDVKPTSLRKRLITAAKRMLRKAGRAD